MVTQDHSVIQSHPFCGQWKASDGLNNAGLNHKVSEAVETERTEQSLLSTTD